MKNSELKQLIKEVISEITIDDQLNQLFNELVPGKGAAETIEGEMIRAISRIIYRYYNDGDFYFKGYGRETVLPSVAWLMTKSPLISQLKPIFNKAKTNAPKGDRDPNQYTENDGYDSAIYDAAKLIIGYVKSKKGNYMKNTGEDSR